MGRPAGSVNRPKEVIQAERAAKQAKRDAKKAAAQQSTPQS